MPPLGTRLGPCPQGACTGGNDSIREPSRSKESVTEERRALSTWNCHHRSCVSPCHSGTSGPPQASSSALDTLLLAEWPWSPSTPTGPQEGVSVASGHSR